MKYIPDKVYNPEDNPEMYPEGIPIMKVVAPVVTVDPVEPMRVRFDPPKEITVPHTISISLYAEKS